MAKNRLQRVLAPMIAILVVLAGAAALATPAQAAVIGPLTVSPTSGTSTAILTFSTAAQCDQGTNVVVNVAGNGIQTDTQRIVGNTPITSFPTNLAGGFDVGATYNLTDFANIQSPPATLSGRYDFTIVCKVALGATSYGTFTGSIWFTGANAWQNFDPAAPPTTTIATLTATPVGSATQGSQVQFDATISPQADGQVTFKDGSTVLGTRGTTAGVATLQTNTLTTGTHSLTAVFVPDSGQFSGSTSSALSYKIVPKTTTAIAMTPALQATVGTNVAIKATVAPSGAAGSIQFRDAGIDIGAPQTVSAGVATLNTTSLALGSHTLSVAFTPTDPLAYGSSLSPVLAYTIHVPQAPTLTKAATATGAYKVGYPLTCSAAFVEATGVTYAWLNNGAVISGAKTNKLTLTGAYYNRYISCRVSASNAIGTTTSTSANHKIALGSKPVLKKAPAISGTAKYGKTLTCSKGTWSLPSLTYSYQWKRGGKAISGSAAKRYYYKATKADKGKKLTCTVTVKKAGYASNAATSAARKVAS